MELEKLFEERPSRPEDIEAIKMLHTEVLKKDEEVKKMVE